MGSGNENEVKSKKNKKNKKNKNTDNQQESVLNPVGKLHFDRNENIMLMITGSKIFTLYDPAQGEALYADIPLRQASLQLDFDMDTGMCVCV